MNPQLNQLALFDVRTALTRPYAVSLMDVSRRMTCQLLNHQQLTAKQVQTWMNQEFNGTESQGTWTWKDCYEAQEAALV